MPYLLIDNYRTLAELIEIVLFKLCGLLVEISEALGLLGDNRGAIIIDLLLAADCKELNAIVGLDQ